ncbi:uncharacterized protein LOC119556420 [Drosophila subpulchrella]|uniref:uncharacterized protein LOC119556420 n=1 Tax=Drosophila subpulchrella TaxID=1486046 RepID=UPI0018A17976|nr:uncharacterized protein LOC119556420 [Drosophila subpulchrella]
MNKTRPYLSKVSTDFKPPDHNTLFKVEKLLVQFAKETEMLDDEVQPPESETIGNESPDYESLEYESVENEPHENESPENEPVENESPEIESPEAESPEAESPENETLDDEPFENESIKSEFFENELIQKELYENSLFANEPFENEGPEDEPSKDDDDGFVTLSHQIKPVYVLMEYIQKTEFTDIIITIGDHMFLCHSVVLCIYSELLLTKILELPIGEDKIVFDEVELSPKGFSDAYEWMISSEGTPDSSNLLEMLRTAYYLEINELLGICWGVLDKHLYDEFSAFNVLYELRGATELEEVFEIMSGRVSRATMAVLASREFMSLAEVQVCHFLKSSSLSVNSETEILYGALSWLLYGWPERRSSTNAVLKNIRFAYLSPTMLSKFKALEQNEIGPFSEVLEEFSQCPEFMPLIRDGLFNSSLIITVYNDPSCIDDNDEFKQVKVLDPRSWIYDLSCEYHRPVTRMCPNMRYITFEEFSDYLEILREGQPDFDKDIQYPDDKKYGELNPQWQMKQDINKISLFTRVMSVDEDEYIKQVQDDYYRDHCDSHRTRELSEIVDSSELKSLPREKFDYFQTYDSSQTDETSELGSPTRRNSSTF